MVVSLYPSQLIDNEEKKLVDQILACLFHDHWTWHKKNSAMDTFTRRVNDFYIR